MLVNHVCYHNIITLIKLKNNLSCTVFLFEIEQLQQRTANFVFSLSNKDGIVHLLS